MLPKFHGWLKDKRDQVLPGTALGKGLAFALGERPKLIRYLDYPQSETGQQLLRTGDRPFVVGRKNWLFP